MTTKTTLSAIFSAMACPICFPKLALIGSLFGMNFLAQYEIYFFYLFHLLVLYAFYKQVRFYLENKNNALFAVSALSTALFFVSLYLIVNEWLSYLALAGIMVAAFMGNSAKAKCSECVDVKEAV